MYIIKKKFSKKPKAETYYYIVENKIKKGRPTVMHIKYLGSIKKIIEVYEFFERNKKES